MANGHDAGTRSFADAGPHVYVRGSHNRRRIKHQLTLLVGHPADEVLGFYGEDSAVTLTGKAGTGFVEDPFGFHMGTLAKQSPRLMMCRSRQSAAITVNPSSAELGGDGKPRLDAFPVAVW